MESPNFPYNGVAILPFDTPPSNLSHLVIPNRHQACSPFVLNGGQNEGTITRTKKEGSATSILQNVFRVSNLAWRMGQMNSVFGPMFHRLSFPWIIVLMTLPCVAQGSAQRPHPSADTTSASEPTATFASFTRLVTIEVVARDRHGHHVTGLMPGDFEIVEQDIRDNKKRPEKIATFREIHFATLAKESPPPMKVPVGVYTDVVTLQKNPAPPTILLIDGLNTQIKDQAQIQVQLDRIIKAIPENTPVAIFLLGSRLRILQDFSTDPELLKTALLRLALKKASSSASAGLATGDPMDNPNYASAQLENLRGHESDITGSLSVVDAQIQAMADSVQKLELSEYKQQLDLRMFLTLEALTSLGHYVAGYPGRKNLIWISSAFPIKLNGTLLTTGADDRGYASYAAQIRRATSILSDAKIAIYPVNPAGVQPHAIYDADAVPRNYSGPGMAATMSREIVMLADQDETMRVIAQDTGGVVCNGSNDLGECLTKALDDSSSYYEISYYPDSQHWNGDYRKIIVESKRSGLHLEYRHGYFAGQAPYENQKAELQQAACQGYLGATSVVFAATKLPVQSGELKFYLDIDPETLTLSPASDDAHDFSIQVAACTFDKNGKPLQLISQPISGKLSSKEYQSVARNGLTHVIAIPAPLPAAVRLVVKDVATDHIGSVHVNLENVVSATAAASKPSGTATETSK